MLSNGSDIYLLVLNEHDDKVLHHGVIVGVHGQAFVAEFEGTLTPPVGAHCKVHCEVNRKFMQQPCTVQAVLKSEPRPVIGFVKVGEASNAENRAAYRVSVVTSNLTAQVGDETDCLLLDVSATGFGFIAAASVERGSEVNVNIAFQGQTYTGKAYVHSVREHEDGKFRYGVQAQDQGTLLKGLETISSAVQREQLRRLSGQAG